MYSKYWMLIFSRNFILLSKHVKSRYKNAIVSYQKYNCDTMYAPPRLTPNTFDWTKSRILIQHPSNTLQSQLYIQ